LHEAVSSFSHIFRHADEPSLFGETFSSLFLVLSSHSEGLGLDVCSHQFEDFLDILDIEVT
jgi:hypothetical protein